MHKVKDVVSKLLHPSFLFSASGDTNCPVGENKHLFIRLSIFISRNENEQRLFKKMTMEHGQELRPQSIQLLMGILKLQN